MQIQGSLARAMLNVGPDLIFCAEVNKNIGGRYLQHTCTP